MRPGATTAPRITPTVGGSTARATGILRHGEAARNPQRGQPKARRKGSGRNQMFSAHLPRQRTKAQLENFPHRGMLRHPRLEFVDHQVLGPWPDKMEMGKKARKQPQVETCKSRSEPWLGMQICQRSSNLHWWNSCFRNRLWLTPISTRWRGTRPVSSGITRT